MKSGLAVVTAYSKSVSRPGGEASPQEPPTASPAQNESGYQGPGSLERLFEKADLEARKRYKGKPFTPEASGEMGRLNDEIERLLKIGKAQEKTGEAAIHDTFRAFRRVVERWYQLYIETNEKGTR